MEWLKGLNEGLNYIEEKLTDDIDYQELAKLASCSLYNYQRIFSYIAGVPLAEYIRRRKMTLAAFELINSDIKVLDLALKYGYESAESFSRTFQNHHGISPSKARIEGVLIKAYPKIKFQLSVKGVSEMNYRIETKESFEVYGIEGIFTMEDSKNFIDIPNFWTEKMMNGEVDTLAATTKIATSKDECLAVKGLCGYEKFEGDKFPYMLCAFKTPASETKGYKVVTVPQATWAIIKNEPHDETAVATEMQTLLKSFYTDWLPTSGYKIVEGFDIEVYYQTPDGKRYEEIWIRITKE